jgi:hypothetical protein
MRRINFFNQSIGLFLQREQQGFLTPEQLDDELELKTGCRFGNASRCSNPDCQHRPVNLGSSN